MSFALRAPREVVLSTISYEMKPEPCRTGAEISEHANAGGIDIRRSVFGRLIKAKDSLRFSIKSRDIQKEAQKRVMFLAENLKIPLSASIAFVWTNAEWDKPKPLLQAERANTQDERSCMSALFLLVKLYDVQ